MNNISLQRGWRLSRLGRVALPSAFSHLLVLLTILSDAVAQLASAFGLYVRVLASGVASTTIRYDTIVRITTRNAAAITDLWYVFFI